jgi:hypothetical protein
VRGWGHHSPCANGSRNGPSAEAGGLRAGAVPFRALSERRIYTIGENKSRAGLLLSYPELWRGNPFDR